MKLRLFSLLALAACASAEAKPPSDLSFLSGYWLSCAGDEEVSETWTARGGAVIGVGLSTGKGEPIWEFARIGPATSGSGLSYFAMPSGQPPAEFPLSSDKSTATKLVFENLAHDFPQRVIYARDGSDLTARIEGMVDGKLQSMNWRYKPATLNTRCL